MLKALVDVRATVVVVNLAVRHWPCLCFLLPVIALQVAHLRQSEHSFEIALAHTAIAPAFAVSFEALTIYYRQTASFALERK